MNSNENASGLWIAQSSGFAKINDGEFWMEYSGEILLRGRRDETGTFVLEEIARIALAGWVGPEDPFGRVTIAGPVEAVPTGEQRGSGGETDAFIPPVVSMRGELVWEQVFGDDRTVGLSVKLFLTDDEGANLDRGLENLARTITFNDALELTFASVDDALPDDSPDTVVEGEVFYRLCTRPVSPCAAGAPEMLIRRLRIRFVCLFAATEDEQGELPGLCARQVAGACEVWREQAILAVQAEESGGGIVVEYVDEWRRIEEFTDSVTAWNVLIAAANAPSTIDIFVVREVKRQNGSRPSGVAYDITTANAGVVLSLWALRDGGHRHLLAHELG
ncbi:MAG: hypothetical protein NTV69_10330, partial [Caldilinea sp.]|nr:hypothetical protein [Caldilinea sp.]